MSHPLTDAPSARSLPDLVALAETLRQTAQALLAAGPPAPVAEPGDAPAAEKPSEVRTYRVPGYIVEEERILLAQHQAQSRQEMFDKTCNHLHTLIFLLQHFETGASMDGYAVTLLGDTLMAPLDTLNSLCSLVADFRLQPKRDKRASHLAARSQAE